MKDLISIQRADLLHPKFKPFAVGFIDALELKYCVTIRISQGLRTFAEQGILYAQGRTTAGNIVTYSPAGTSYHNYGLAVDLVVLEQTGSINWAYNYSLWVNTAAQFNLTWGGTFVKKDLDHYENKFNYNWRDLLHKYTTKDFITGTQFVNI